MRKLAMLSALTAATWLLAMVVIGGASFPGYDHFSHFISELGATGAPYGSEVSWYGFLPVGVLVIVFAVSAWIAAPRSVLGGLGFAGILLFAAGYVSSAFFPCDFGCRPKEPSLSQQMHLLFGLAGYVLAPVTLLFLGLAARSWPGAIWLSSLGFLSAAGALGGLVTMDEASPYAGLSQRVLEASVMGWVVACGLHLGRRPAGQA